MAEGIQSPNPRTSSSWALFPPRLELHLISEDESNLACGLTNSNIYIVTTSKPILWVPTKRREGIDRRYETRPTNREPPAGKKVERVGSQAGELFCLV